MPRMHKKFSVTTLHKIPTLSGTTLCSPNMHMQCTNVKILICTVIFLISKTLPVEKFTNCTLMVIFPNATKFEILPLVVTAMCKFTNLIHLIIFDFVAWLTKYWYGISVKQKLTDFLYQKWLMYIYMHK